MLISYETLLVAALIKRFQIISHREMKKRDTWKSSQAKASSHCSPFILMKYPDKWALYRCHGTSGVIVVLLLHLQPTQLFQFKNAVKTIAHRTCLRQEKNYNSIVYNRAKPLVCRRGLQNCSKPCASSPQKSLVLHEIHVYLLFQTIWAQVNYTTGWK